MKWENYLDSHLVIAYIEDKSICIFLKKFSRARRKRTAARFLTIIVVTDLWMSGSTGRGQVVFKKQ